MRAAQLPTKFSIPFANSAGGSYITAIPVASQIGVTGGRASLTDGFPPLCFLPISGGGIPPWGADFNGLLNQITAWNQWQGAGGQVVFDSTFVTSIGGYPQGALLAAASSGNLWVSLQDNNTTNPDTTPGNPGWVAVGFIPSIQNNSYISADDTGTADNYVCAPVPLITSLQKYQRFQVKIGHTNLTTTPNLNVSGVSGLLGARTIIHTDGSAIIPGELAAGGIATFIYDGTFFQLLATTARASLLTPLKKLVVTGYGQQLPFVTEVQVVCLTTISQNTLSTSSWNGQQLTIGTGEDGLWSCWFNLQLGPVAAGVTLLTGFTWLNQYRNGGLITQIGIGEVAYAQPIGLTILDLMVGDVVTITAASSFVGAFTMPIQPGATAFFYRIEGLQWPTGYTG